MFTTVFLSNLYLSMSHCRLDSGLSVDHISFLDSPPDVLRSASELLLYLGE